MSLATKDSRPRPDSRLSGDCRRRLPKAPAPGLWNMHDTRTVLRLPATLAAALLLPVSWQERLLRRLAAGKRRRRPISVRNAESILGPFFARTGVAGDPRSWVEELLFHNEMARLLLFAQYRPRPPQPDILLQGAEEVTRALDTGRGAILWVAPMAYASLISKMAWHRQGWKVSHLSRYSHGGSGTRLGSHLINPLVCRVEDRYLGERVRIERGRSPAAAMRVIRRRLLENRPVSITALAGESRAAEAVLLGRRIRLSPGPPRLAAATGAALLPVFCWKEPDGRHVLRIGTALPTAGNPIGAVEGFVAAWESMLKRVPTQLAWPTAMGMFTAEEARS